MGEIQQLSEEVIIKIAAGEVIERPASVVKELLENSIDAGAKNISLFIDKESIRILDDGKGMEKEDLALCYVRHTTSKISSTEDLFNINSLGFRGEALASITAVSKTRVTSKRGDLAKTITITGGVASHIAPTAFPYDHGTEIEVRDLFFNTPARKKYMKTWATELRVMLDVVQQYALSYQRIAFTCTVEGKISLKAPATLEYKERFFHVYGADMAKHMISIEEAHSTDLLSTKQHLSQEGITIKGLISKPQLYRRTRDEQILFVNGRLIKSKTIFAAIAQAYTGYLNTGEYPVVMLDVYINPQKIDVNVHPTKQEIKFDDEQTIFRAIYYTVIGTLRASNLVIKVEAQEQQKEDVSKQVTLENKSEKENNYSYQPTLNRSEPLRVPEVFAQTILEDTGASKQRPLEVTDKEDNSIKVLSIFNKEFILAQVQEQESKLLIIDFYAAAEIVNYEKLSKQFEEKNVATQALIEPITVNMTPADMSILRENIALFNELGFTLEEFGPTTILIRSIPSLFGRHMPTNIIFDLISEIRNEKQVNSIQKKKDAIIIRMACRASEKAGDDITLVQAQQILSNLYRLKKNSYNCPHGRPTIIEFSKYELEKMFKRIR